MENLPWIALLLLLILQLVALVKSVRKRRKRYWISAFSLGIVCIAAAMAIYVYYDSFAPQGGFMPGLANLGEELFSLGAAVLSFLILGGTAIAAALIFDKKRR